MSHNYPFFKELENHTPFDAEEEGHKQTIIKLFDQTDIPFSREALAGHITGSAFVVNKSFDKCFMILHKKLGLWLQPGGHCDGDPDVGMTALRETEEEAGLQDITLINRVFDVDVHPVPERTKNGKLEPKHFHHDVRYLIIANEDEKVTIQEEEIDGAGWFTFEEAVKKTPWRPFSRMVDKIVSNRQTYIDLAENPALIKSLCC